MQEVMCGKAFFFSWGVWKKKFFFSVVPVLCPRCARGVLGCARGVVGCARELDFVLECESE